MPTRPRRALDKAISGTSRYCIIAIGATSLDVVPLLHGVYRGVIPKLYLLEGRDILTRRSSYINFPIGSLGLKITSLNSQFELWEGYYHM